MMRSCSRLNPSDSGSEYVDQIRRRTALLSGKIATSSNGQQQIQETRA
jgi:hypothetical protein